MPDTSIVVTAQDNYSSSVKKMSKVTKAFDKDAEHMEQVLKNLSKQKASINLDVKKAKAELNALQKQFAKTGSEADELEVQMQQTKVDNLVRNLNLVSKTARNAEKHMQTLGDGIVKAHNKGEASGFNKMVGAFAASGLGQMAGGFAVDFGSSFMASYGGSDAGNLFSSGLSSASSGAAIGTMLAPGIGTAVGAAAGGIIGIAQGALKNYENKDEFFKQSYNEAYEQGRQSTSAGIASGSDYQSRMEQYSTSFRVMTGSQAEAGEIVKSIVGVAATTPFAQEDLVGTTQTLMKYGMDADAAIGKMGMLGDISLGDANNMQRMADAFGKMSSSGKVTLERINQMTEAGFNPLTEISETTGESVENLYDRISKGKLTLDEITASMERATSEGGMYFQSMQLQSETFKGLKSTFEDTMAIIEGGYGEGYNKTRKEGYTDNIEAWGGTLGDAYSIMKQNIGQGQAYMDNLADQYSREAYAAVLTNSDTTLYDKKGQQQLAEWQQEYLRLNAQLRTADETEKADISQQLGALDEQIQTFATSNYESSEQNTKLIETENSLIEATKNLEMEFGNFEVEYHQGQTTTEGMASTDAKDIDASDMEDLRTRWGPNAWGLNSVPYDDYPALLHQGERVLTASQAREADRSTGGDPVVLSGNTFYVREEADIQKVANALADLINLARMGGVYNS